MFDLVEEMQLAWKQSGQSTTKDLLKRLTNIPWKSFMNCLKTWKICWKTWSWQQIIWRKGSRKPLVQINTNYLENPLDKQKHVDLEVDASLTTASIKQYVRSSTTALIELQFGEDDKTIQQITVLFNHYFALARERATANMMNVDLISYFEN